MMNKIITRPQEIEKNKRVLYAGNHYISLPEIDVEDASIKNLNIISLSNKGLVELSGGKSLFELHFYKKGKELEIVKSEIEEILSYIPFIKLYFKDGSHILIKIYADLKEKGFVYEFESSE